MTNLSDIVVMIEGGGEIAFSILAEIMKIHRTHNG